MIVLRSFAALAVTALLLQALPSKAQDSTSSSGSTSSSSSSSGSVSGSRSGASTTSGTSGNQQRTNQRVNSTTNIPITFNSADPAGTNGSNGSGGGNPGGSLTPGGSTGQPYYGQSDVTIRSAPPVYAPNVQGGNPCTVGYSVGVSWIGAGVAGGMSSVDEDCANRQKIAMVHNAGYAGAAKELMCNDKATYFAFRSSGQPCVPRPQFDGPPVAGARPGPTPTPQPVQIAPPPQQMVTKDRTNLPRCSRTITDNCYGG